MHAGDGYLVQGLDTDAANVETARRHIRSLGLYGKVAADRLGGSRLPYVDNLVNLIVAEDLGTVPMAEVTRVLCPGGVAYLRRDHRFSRRWRGLRQEQLLREDVRDFTQIQQIGQLETLVNLLRSRSAGQLIYSNLAKHVRVSVDTTGRWIDALCGLHLGFTIKPWFKNVSRSLRKEPKWLLRDWASIEDPGKRAETFVGCHLLKAVEGWNDMGLGDFRLGYLRDKSQREVDFVVVRDGKPWFLAEVKHREQPIGKHLEYFQEQTGAPLAFQVVVDADYVDADCFASPRGPLTVPAKTLLSQLL